MSTPKRSDGGGSSAHPLSGDQRLAGAVLETVRDDLRQPRSCVRHDLARAWLEGKYRCGCAHEEAFPIERVAEYLGEDVAGLRRRIYRDLQLGRLVPPRVAHRAPVVVIARQLELPFVRTRRRASYGPPLRRVVTRKKSTDSRKFSR